MNSIDDIRALLADPWQRITSGRLYKIKVKAQAIAPLATLADMSDEEHSYSEIREDEGTGGGGSGKDSSDFEREFFKPPVPKNFQNFKNLDVQGASPIILPATMSDQGEDQILPFIPNDAQLKLLKHLWTRNVILKARQLGFTTLVAIMWLDHALFNGRQKCAMIAHTKDAAEEIFRDKVLLAYNELPETLRERMPLAQQSSTSVEFAHNGSRIVVTNSGRSGTFDRVHVSEFGKISARDPGKAREVITGSLPAVPMDGIVIVESTAEGQTGEFFDMVQKAMAHMHAEKKLNKKEFRFHFYAWWQNPEYTLNDPSMRISSEDEEYFEAVEGLVRETGYDLTLTHDQKCWWVAERDNTNNGSEEKMWQENPSYPAESFKVSLDGVYYAKQLSVARKQKRIGLYPHIPGTPVDTFWDIGSTDGTGIWLMQRLGGERRFIRYIEGWEEGYDHYTKALQDTGFLWGTHYLPHDADHKRPTHRGLTSPKEELEKTRLGGKWVIVARVDDLQHGIQMTRTALSACTFDQAGCKKGLDHLWNYRKMWNRKAGAWSGQPDKSAGHSEAADALRQFAQAGGGAPSQGGPSRDSIRKHVNRKRNR
jgi:hypothetical protein